MRELNLSQAKLLADLVIPVQIVLGELSLSAAQLIDLRAGEQYQLELDEYSLVTLVVSGEPIARGKLVKDNSDIYIQITETISPENISPATILMCEETITSISPILP